MKKLLSVLTAVLLFSSCTKEMQENFPNIRKYTTSQKVGISMSAQRDNYSFSVVCAKGNGNGTFWRSKNMQSDTLKDTDVNYELISSDFSQDDERFLDSAKGKIYISAHKTKASYKDGTYSGTGTFQVIVCSGEYTYLQDAIGVLKYTEQHSYDKEEDYPVYTLTLQGVLKK